jgi:glycosyltransferase involved in cell wall biosynthesis
MRVAFVVADTTHRRDTQLGRRVERTAALLAARGHEVLLLCRQWWDGDHSTFEQDGISYRRVTDGDGDARFAANLPFAILRADPDVIHAAYTAEQDVLAARLGAALARAPLVVDWYGTEKPIVGDDPRSELRRRARRSAARSPEAIVAPSETVRTRVREFGADGDDVTVIPNSIDFDAIREADTGGVADVVYSRRLDDDANLESLLLALAELRDRDWSAAIIGDGPRREAYERQARDLRIDDRVTFAGDQPIPKRIQAFKGAQVFVQTSYREAFPTDLLRALACGCVGIVEYHADSSAHELVEHVDRGFRTTSEQELTDALVEAADIPHRQVDESFAEYDESATVDRYLDVYDAASERVSLRPLATAGAVVVLLVVLFVIVLGVL